MHRTLLLAAAAALAALALVALTLLGGSGESMDDAREAPERRPGPAAPSMRGPSDLEAAPARVERAPEADAGPGDGPSAADGDAEPWRLLVRVVTAEPEEPLAGWRVVLTEVGARGRAPLASEHRATLGPDGVGHFEDLPRRGPWFVHLSDARPRGRGWDALQERLGAASASTDPDAPPVRFEVPRGPTVLLTSPLPAGVAPTDLLFRVRAAPSVLSSQIGGLGGVGRGRASPEASAAAMTPRITNSVRGEGAFVEVWSEDGGWWVRQHLGERVENDARIEVDAPLEPAGRLRYRLEGPDGRLGEMVIRAVERSLRQGEVGAQSAEAVDGLERRALHTVALGDGVFEVHGLTPGPVWIEGGAHVYGVRLAPLQAQASPANPAEVTVEVLGLEAGGR